MKIAQIVLTKTKHGTWRVAVMSMKATESVRAYRVLSDALADINKTMTSEEWEQLSL